jgi:hypothetical protein
LEDVWEKSSLIDSRNEHAENIHHKSVTKKVSLLTITAVTLVSLVSGETGDWCTHGGTGYYVINKQRQL